ncbi:MAG: hypothetical protein IKQ04_04845 [Oscillospiraceae bacterium]|nr:hypothetical protein [Oscillospiraceae bacterium]
MPKFQRPSKEEYQRYVKQMRTRKEELQKRGGYSGFFPENSKRMAALEKITAPLYSYIQNASGLPREERSDLIKPLGLSFVWGALSVRIKDETLMHLLDLKNLLESTAPDGRTHFENMMDFAYASGVGAEFLPDAALALKEDLCLDLQTPALKLEKVPNPGLENRAKEEKIALEWIAEFKADARRAAAGGGAEPDTAWLMNTLAVRSLAESKRHKSGKLKQTRFSAAQIAERANQLMADRGVRGYVKSLKANPREYARAVELLQKGNGGRVEDQLTAYTVATKQVPFSTLGKRYRPTAKQMIELMQGTLKNPQSSTAEKQEALAAIIAVRKAEGVKRAALGLRADAALEKQITNYVRFQHTAELALQELKTLSQQEQSSLMEAACSGHGGAMLQSYDSLLQQAQAQPAQPQAKPVQPQAQPGKS